ncbi:class F sortase [Streptomyces sp. JNUCC 64]
MRTPARRAAVRLPSSRAARRRGDALIAGGTALALAAGVWLLGGTGAPPPQPSAAQSARALPGDAGRTAAALPPSPPDRVRIPSIGVDAPLTGLRLTADGGLDAPPPDRPGLAGWYEAGTTPGERGTAVVAGHVDNAAGPAVFYRLGALERGRTVEIDRRDGTVAVFTVTAVEVHPADDFPDERVYGPAPGPELRVITCGGPYSERTGYTGNVVVFARLTDVR